MSKQLSTSLDADALMKKEKERRLSLSEPSIITAHNLAQMEDRGIDPKEEEHDESREETKEEKEEFPLLKRGGRRYVLVPKQALPQVAHPLPLISQKLKPAQRPVRLNKRGSRFLKALKKPNSDLLESAYQQHNKGAESIQTDSSLISKAKPSTLHEQDDLLNSSLYSQLPYPPQPPQLIRPSFKISLKRSDNPSQPVSSHAAEEADELSSQCTLSPRLARSSQIDNLILDRLITSALTMLQQISLSGEQQRNALKEILKHPDLPRILNASLQPSGLLKPRLSHFIGKTEHLSFIEEGQCNVNQTQPISHVTGWAPSPSFSKFKKHEEQRGDPIRVKDSQGLIKLRAEHSPIKQITLRGFWMRLFSRQPKSEQTPRSVNLKGRVLAFHNSALSKYVTVLDEQTQSEGAGAATESSSPRRQRVCEYNLENGSWSLIQDYANRAPIQRVGVAGCVWRGERQPCASRLLLVGGCSLHRAKPVYFNDIFVYNMGKPASLTIEAKKWEGQFPASGTPLSNEGIVAPQPRAYHAAALWKSILILSGGVGTQGQLLQDMWFFSLHERSWHRILPFEMQSDHTFSPEALAFHTLTPIFLRTTALKLHKKQSLRRSKQKIHEWTVNSGFYIFGGVKANGKETNELYILRSLSQEHQVVEPDRAYYFQCVKPEIKGRAPIPRSHHSACWLSSQYLVIYGGRSSQLISGGAHVCVNDVVALNVELLQWEVVAAYGYHPDGRWSAGILEVEKKIVILGGENQDGSLGEQPFCLETDGGHVKDLIATFKQKCEQFEKYRHFLQSAREMGKGGD